MSESRLAFALNSPVRLPFVPEMQIILFIYLYPFGWRWFIGILELSDNQDIYFSKLEYSFWCHERIVFLYKPVLSIVLYYFVSFRILYLLKWFDRAVWCFICSYTVGVFVLQFVADYPAFLYFNPNSCVVSRDIGSIWMCFWSKS